MSTILVIEPYTVLQHAIVVALFPEHQIRIAEAVPDFPGDADIVIVDANALRERNGLSSAELQRIAVWHRPIVWIDSVNGAEPTPPAKLVRLQIPLKRDDLKMMVAACLNNTAGTPDRTMQTPPSNHVHGRVHSTDSRAGADRQVIELTEIYEDNADDAAKGRQKE